MNYSVFRFTLNMHSHRSQASVAAFLGDTAIRLLINITDGGNPYVIADGCTAVLSGTKADGTKLLNRCVILNNTTIQYDFTEQTTSWAGVVNCELTIYGRDKNVITAPKFIIVVDEREVNSDEIIESENERTALDAMFTAEIARAEAEAARVAAEEARVIAENTRMGDEGRRFEFEEYREQAESLRVDAENDRKLQESLRAEAEQARIEAEEAREYQEDIREAMESDRRNAEEERQRQEEDRVEAEKLREEAEQRRKEAVEGFIADLMAGLTPIDETLHKVNEGGIE